MVRPVSNGKVSTKLGGRDGVWGGEVHCRVLAGIQKVLGPIPRTGNKKKVSYSA